jgi:hypothetical protein
MRKAVDRWREKVRKPEPDDVISVREGTGVTVRICPLCEKPSPEPTERCAVCDGSPFDRPGHRPEVGQRLRCQSPV